MRFRIGINLGDVIHDETRIYGDGINVAARLKGSRSPAASASPPGVRPGELIDQGRLQALGPRTLKNIAHPVDVFAIAPADAGPGPGVTAPNAVELRREIRFAPRPTVSALPYSSIGQGPPLMMKTGNWMTHLEYDLEPDLATPVSGAGEGRTLIRYDARGNGLSDRTVDEISFDTYVSDLEAVVDATGLTRFALFGISQGCAISIAYAVRHPERVSHLVLYGGFALGFHKSSRTAAEGRRLAP
jgi:pimeloyl-ACP methyl ester carboxylesterase